MKVKEAIEYLKRFHPDAKVHFQDGCIGVEFVMEEEK